MSGGWWLRARIGVYLLLSFRERELEELECGEAEMVERSEESRGDGDGEGVRIAKLSDFISGGFDGQANKQAWCLVTLDKSIEPRGIGTLESG